MAEKFTTREQIEVELRRRGWKYLAPPGLKFQHGRWVPSVSTGLWFRPEKRQAEYLSRVRGVLFVNAAIEEGIDPEPSFALLHSRYMPATISGGWVDGIKRTAGGFLVDIDKRDKYLKRRAKK